MTNNRAINDGMVMNTKKRLTNQALLHMPNLFTHLLLYHITLSVIPTVLISTRKYRQCKYTDYHHN